MKPEQKKPLTTLAVILHHMEKAARQGDVKALKGHSLVYQAIVDRAKTNT